MKNPWPADYLSDPPRQPQEYQAFQRPCYHGATGRNTGAVPNPPRRCGELRCVESSACVAEIRVQNQVVMKHHERRGCPDARGKLLVQTIGAAFWSFLYRPPLMDCRVMRSCSRAASSNSTLCRFHWSHRTNLRHTTWPVSSWRTSYRMPSGFSVVHIMAYPFGSGGKITVGNGALKMETPSRGVLRPRRRLDLSYTNVYAGSLAKSYAYPGPSLRSPNRTVPYQGPSNNAMTVVRS